ncbi:DUF898 domain-containing protein, partial [Shigella sonnei]
MNISLYDRFLSDDIMRFSYTDLLSFGNDSNLLIVFYVQIMPD